LVSFTYKQLEHAFIISPVIALSSNVTNPYSSSKNFPILTLSGEKKTGDAFNLTKYTKKVYYLYYEI